MEARWRPKDAAATTVAGSSPAPCQGDLIGPLHLAHTHIPTIWDDTDVVLDNVDWTRHPSGELEKAWRLPNRIRFGARVTPEARQVDLELWIENGTKRVLKDMRAQICLMLKEAQGFNYLANTPKRYENGVAAAPSETGDRWVFIAFDHCVRPWGNEDVPCIHSDPGLADAAPGERVSVRGRVWFYEGRNPDKEIARAATP